ncbi:MAG: calcium/sodium antiporter [Thermoplasmata archaeon]|nr:calcium/sodium antiporter [Thermoplasmata archaeon]
MRKNAFVVAFLAISLIIILYLQNISWKWNPLLLLILGGFSLVAGSDLFVEGAAGLASQHGISEHAVGLTIVAFGTSLPEFAVSFIASLKKHGGVAIGNVLGSNVANILLIMGIAMLLMPLKPSKFALKDSLYMLAISLAIVVASLDGMLKAYDGILLLIFYFIFIYFLYKRKSVEAKCESSLGYAASILLLLLGIVAITIGGNATVGGAVDVARLLGVSETAVAASIVAFGTSLPELSTSVMATLKKYHGIAIGNIIGSNIVNLGVVLGSACIVKNISVAMDFMMLFFLLAALLATFVIWRKIYGRAAGLVFLLLYFIFLILLYL